LILALLLCLSGILGSTPTYAQPALPLAPRAARFTPLFWAEGIMRADQLDDYTRVGFNTVVIRLFWQPTQDGSIVASDLQPQRAFAAEAEKRDLKVIYALPPAPYGQELNFAYSGEAGPYRVMWANWTQRAIAQLHDTPNLIGWMLPDDPRALPFVSAQGFSRWIFSNYANLQVLNKQWNTNFTAPEEITPNAVRKIVAAWRGPELPSGAMTDQQARNYIRQQQNRRANDNFAFHPAALALANYQWDSYRALLDFWAQTIRAADPRRKIFSGALPDYAQLLSLPASVDVSVAAARPGLLEPDLASHNPQAVDIARRGGRFEAIPLLSTQLPNTASENIAALAPAWMDSALAHGANGLAFDSWAAITQSADLRRAITASLQRLQSEEYSRLWGQAPQATAAVVLTPLADGITLHGVGSTPNSRGDSRGIYGFSEDMIAGEPSALTYALRWGTAFGAVDFLSSDELGGGYSSAKFGLLKRYGVVLLPQALSISAGMAQELASYVAGGGVIVTDLGVGAVQNGGSVIGLPPELAAMLGVIPTSMQTVAFNLKPGQPHPLLPTWAALMAMQPGMLTAGDGPDGAAFAGPITFGEMLPGTVPLALAFDLTQRIPAGNPRTRADDITRVNRSWLTLRPFGNGVAIFAPFRLWNLWRPGHPGFDALHGDLFARGFALSQPATPALTSTPVGTSTGQVLFCETVNFPNAIALLNHNAAPNPPYGGGVIEAKPNAPESRLVPAQAGSTPGNSSPSEAAIVPDNETAVKPEPAIIPNTIIPNAIVPDTIVPNAIVPEPTIKTQPLLKPRLAVIPSEQTPQAPPEIKKPTDVATTQEPAITLTPEEFQALFGAPPPGSTPGANVPGAPPLSPIGPGSGESFGEGGSTSLPFVPAPENAPQPVVIQTSGAEYFLWRGALCVFPVGAAPTPTPGRSAPLPLDSNEFSIGSIVRPPFYHPLVLYSQVPAMQMKVLSPLPIRVQSVQGGAVAGNVVEYSARKVAFQVWPGTDSAFYRGGEWRLSPGSESKARVTLFDSEENDTYRIAPNSRHRIAVFERAINDENAVVSTTNYQLEADADGRLTFELTGKSIGVEITPLQ
jgi:hypothetical protein